MKEQLTAKEIKEGLSPTPWKACHEGDCVCGQIWSIPQDYLILEGQYKDDELGEIPIYQMKTNVKAATIAVNNTYGKRLNPEVMLDVVFMLEQIGYGKFDNKDPYECIFQIKENALKALKNARI